MTVKECYAQMGADYEEVLGRLGSDALVKRFTLKFLNDKSFSELEQGMQDGDAENAFRGAHTLKGVCSNLGFKALYEVSAALTEKLCGREIAGSEDLYAQVKASYQKHIEAIQQLAQEA